MASRGCRRDVHGWRARARALLRPVWVARARMRDRLCLPERHLCSPSRFRFCLPSFGCARRLSSATAAETGFSRKLAAKSSPVQLFGATSWLRASRASILSYQSIRCQRIVPRVDTSALSGRNLCSGVSVFFSSWNRSRPAGRLASGDGW